jgi:hypothetical protein
MRVRRFSRAGNYAPREPFTLNRDSPTAQGLVGWWPLFGTPYDRGPYKLGGSVGGSGATWPSTDLGQIGFRTNGTANILVPHNPILNGDYILVSMWVNRIAAVNDAGLFAKGGSTTRQYWLWDKGDGTLDAEWDKVALAAFSPGYVAGQMNHLVAWYDGAAFRCWVNGVEKSNQSLATGPILTDTGDLYIGRLPSFGITNAIYQDVRVYSGVYGETMAYALYNPSTRWDLYYELGRRIYSFPAAGGGGATVTGALAAAAAGVGGPTVVLGSIAISGKVASAAGARNGPTVVLASMSVTGALAAAAAAVAGPTVVAGSIAVAGKIAAALGAVAGPLVHYGSTVASGAIAAAKGAVAGPTTVLGSISLAGRIAQAVAAVAGPTVVGGNLIVSGAVAAARAAANAGAIIGQTAFTWFRAVFRPVLRPILREVGDQRDNASLGWRPKKPRDGFRRRP